VNQQRTRRYDGNHSFYFHVNTPLVPVFGNPLLKGSFKRLDVV
jgi:hypothetical protein